MPHPHRLGLLALCLAALTASAPAQIRRLSLEEMVASADEAVHGTILASRTFRLDDPDDGPELFYTTLTIAGRTLARGTPITVDVTFRGGFVSPTEGVYNSEAPAADDVRVGREVVAFYAWTDDFGAGLATNALVAAHGGLFRTATGPRGTAVLGRGDGYAVRANLRIDELEGALRRLYAAKPRR
ncbi:MAG: hypothetical protein ABL998_12950 [Planctomycetota bacterium]